MPPPTNGITLCSGSLGASLDNDVVVTAMLFASPIHLANLRNVTNALDGSVMKTGHLDSDTVALVVHEPTTKPSLGRNRCGAGK